MTDLFTQYFSGQSTVYCRQLWQQYGFGFRVVRPRRSKLGDFRAYPDGRTQVTVNADLNPHAFLITYVHEVAHAAVHLAYRKRYQQNRLLGKRTRRPQPHGTEWQITFNQLMQPLLTESVFPTVVLGPLRQYMQKPAATTSANPVLMHALRQFDDSPLEPVDPSRMLLRDIPEGGSFRLGKKTFVRGTLRRTRVVCKEITSGSSYAILAHAWVEKSSL
ncbi:sprT domain-containing protein [Spirosoma sp. KUDC1026]|uniref:sprT domain-containing protein n=1 Tax=Spirosoma sp. KUDC1026 TaxID=2745947 RepID=UPI00159BB48D|nr:sprT domain-containing protein [Spirosoma sp. KUDC1026]QKZ11960.1 sprT domain-containing protein [Spirosoma sp. KUDC1026]